MDKRLKYFYSCPFCESVGSLQVIEKEKKQYGVTCCNCNFDFPNEANMTSMEALKLKWNMRYGY